MITACRLVRVHLNNQGYDSDGQYWGVGQRLYRYEPYVDAPYRFIRANDRDDAKQQIRKLYPNIKFYR